MQDVIDYGKVGKKHAQEGNEGMRMDNLESEQFPDDEEVEISDLDEPGAGSHPWRLPVPVWKPHLPARPRRFLIIFLNTLVLLVLVLILAAPAGARQLLTDVFVRPTPVPTRAIAPGSDIFYIRLSPAWGRVSLDGHPVSLPQIGTDPPLQLARGQHILLWQAEPFLPQRCTVSVPNDLTDTCIYRDSTLVRSGLSAWIITFTASLATLASAPRAALFQATQNALDDWRTTDTVRPGERYTLDASSPACRHTYPGNQCYATASAPLQATLRFQLNTQAGECIGPQQPSCTLNNLDCRLFCPNPLLVPTQPGVWTVAVPIRALWTFTTLDGRVLERDVPDESAWNAGWNDRPDTSLVPLEISWGLSGWQIAVLYGDQAGGDNFSFFNPVCASSVVVVEALAPPTDASGTPINLRWHFFSGVTRAAGCLSLGIAASNLSVASPPVASSQATVFCLHRFGVLLEVPSMGQPHRSNWLLPPANAYEQQLARQLRTLLPASF